MTYFILNIYYSLIFNIVLLFISVVLIVLRVKQWNVSFPILNIFEVFINYRKISNLVKIKILINTFINDFLNLKRAGFLCEEKFHFYGRFLVLWGFIGVVITNIINGIINPEGLSLGFLHPLTMISYLFYAFLSIGSLMLLLRRIIRINLRKTTDAGVYLLQALLFYFGVLGLILITVINEGISPTSIIIYYLYLASISFIYIYFPLSEIGYYVWKASTLLTHSIIEDSINFDKSEYQKN